MSRHPITWLALTLASALTGYFAWAHFAAAYPVVSLDLTMSREEAQAAARDRAREYAWGPESPRLATSFDADRRTQYYLELEAGGAQAFRELLRGDDYSPYTWRVRLFREGVTREASVRFTPSGTPFAFEETVPEDDPGPALDEGLARDRAEAMARAWPVPLDRFELAESSQELRPSGRLDHTFVYRHTEVSLGEAELRLRLVVRGDRVTELTPFVKVPEGFGRRYEEMRAANHAIANGAGLAVLLLYLMVGCGGGLVLLLRHRAARWRPALAWGLVIAGLELVDGWNQWPHLWMSYDTALSRTSFLLRYAVAEVVGFLGLTLLLTLSFVVAEGLSRLAFSRHPQLWRSWSPGVGNSPEILGRTGLGYLLVAPFLLYEVALYLVAHRSLGWWTPSSALTDPDVLATTFPWLSSISSSLQAGFWEECLFRAVPLAGAALIGRRLGRPRLWITAAWILQAVIFAAGHANYATQPAYARLVELLIPALVFGALYLWLGLLPAIVMHYAYDVVWFALPLFVSRGEGGPDRVMVLLLTFLPLLVVAYRAARGRGLRTLAEGERNGAWTPPPEVETPPAPVRGPGLAPLPTRVALLLGGAGFLVWLASASFRLDAPALPVDKERAIALAAEAVQAQGQPLGAEWRRAAEVEGSPGPEDRFVWETAGPEVYADLLGTWLRPPLWRVRFARFEGEIEPRAEEWIVHVGPGAEVLRAYHRVPEAQPGPSLAEAEARRRAAVVIKTRLGIDPETLEVVAIEPSEQPARRDWRLTYRPETPLALPEGEGRVVVDLAGAQVRDAYRHVDLPESWERLHREQRARRQSLQLIGLLILSGAGLAGVFATLAAWRRLARPPREPFLAALAALAVVDLTLAVNHWPQVWMGFSTARPLRLQLLEALASSALLAGLGAAGLALLAVLAHAVTPAASPDRSRGRTWVRGLSAAGIAAGGSALVRASAPGRQPSWGDYDALAGSLPLVSGSLSPLLTYVEVTGVVLLAVAGTLRLSRGWTVRRLGAGVILALFGAALASLSSPTGGLEWGLRGGGLALGLIGLFWLVWGREPASIPISLAGLAWLGQVRVAVADLYPGAWLGATLACLLIGVAAWFWSRSIAGSIAPGAAPPGPNDPSEQGQLGVGTLHQVGGGDSQEADGAASGLGPTQ